MIIKKNEDVPEASVEEEGIKNVTRKILIGPDDGSSKIVMRHFKVLPEDITVSQGQSLLIEQNKNHQFKNPFHEPFEFLCIIINPEKVK
jgi:hypothetical protein